MLVILEEKKSTKHVKSEITEVMNLWGFTTVSTLVRTIFLDFGVLKTPHG